MDLPFKFIGLTVIFLACTGFGFLKSSRLKKRTEILGEFARSVSRLAGYIRAEQGEIGKLLSLSFDKNILAAENNEPHIKADFLEKEDLSLINEFLKDLGQRDSESEYERAVIYSELLEKHYSDAEKKSSSLCKLYNTTGVLCGILICIFFV